MEAQGPKVEQYYTKDLRWTVRNMWHADDIEAFDRRLSYGIVCIVFTCCIVVGWLPSHPEQRLPYTVCLTDSPGSRQQDFAFAE